MTRVHRLHIITSDEVLQRHAFHESLRVLAGFEVALHLRTRTLSGRALHALAESVATEVPDAGIFINDRVDVALAADAAGVHLPEGGIPPAIVSRIWGTRLVVGHSVHAAPDARASLEQGADYVFLGPIWPTRSHPERPALGTRSIGHANTTPLIAIGGVTPDRVETCLAAGAHGVAVISAFWDAHDPASAIERFKVSFDRALGSGTI